jgi:hypothetical protein
VYVGAGAGTGVGAGAGAGAGVEETELAAELYALVASFFVVFHALLKLSQIPPAFIVFRCRVIIL